MKKSIAYYLVLLTYCIDINNKCAGASSREDWCALSDPCRIVLWGHKNPDFDKKKMLCNSNSLLRKHIFCILLRSPY